MPTPTRTDLGLGAACGLAASTAVWGLALDPPAASATTALVLAAAVVAGTAAARMRLPGALDPTYPVILAALLADGAGTSVLAAVVAAAAALAGREPSGRPASILTIAISTTAAGVAAASLLLALPVASPLGAWAIHGAAFSTTRYLLGMPSDRGSHASPAAPRWAAAVGAILAGAGLAWTLEPSRHALAASGMLLATALPVHRAIRRERRSARDAAAAAARTTRAACSSLAELIATRDGRTREHGERVQRLAVAVGRRIGLSRAALRALARASVLHDVGTLALPDRILDKPGGLDPEESARVRSHPATGAGILDRLPGCRAVADMVRHHHERWDGTGYPRGLRGDEIPIGARILAVVDHYDALVSDRPHRRALAPSAALDFLQREAGGMFDAFVVEALIDCLEERPDWAVGAFEPFRDVGPRGAGADAGPGELPLAQLELQTLYDLGRARDYAIGLDDFLTLAASKLARVVPHSALVVYRLDGRRHVLRARFATGLAANRLRTLEFGLGERLSGRSALERRALRGSDPTSAPDRGGFRSDLEDRDDDPDLRELRAELAAPLAVGDRSVGVLTLYDRAGRRFTDGERRALVRVAARIADVVDRDADHGPAGFSLTDPLTGVPNARFLRVEAAHRIMRAAQDGGGFGLLAFRVLGLESVTARLGPDLADRVVAHVARRLACATEPGDTLVRFGPDLFLVLTGAFETPELVRRWHALALEVEQPLSLHPGGPVHQVRLCAAHAAHPTDGAALDELLVTLDERLAPVEREGRRIVPFRAPRAG